MKRIICLLSAVLSITHSFAAPYHYDANGNMTEDNVGNLYIYSATNQLVGVQNVNHKLNDNNHYNAAGFRDARNIDGHTVGLIYKDGQLINELNNQLKSSYLEHDVRYVELSSEHHQYRMSANNNSASLLLADNSSIESSYNYNAYGASARYADNSPKMFGIKTNLIAHNPLTYDGEYQDHDSGLIYLRARFYNPKTMRFMQRDSYNLLNRYAFANSNPVNNIDPNGHSAFGDFASAFVDTLGSFSQGLGDGLISGATIGFCSHYGCSINNYGQLATGDASSFVELFNPIAAIVAVRHSSNPQAWAEAIGMVLPNLDIIGKDFAAIASRPEPESLIETIIPLSPEAVENDKIIKFGIMSRRSGLNYIFDPAERIYSRYNPVNLEGVDTYSYLQVRRMSSWYRRILNRRIMMKDMMTEEPSISLDTMSLSARSYSTEIEFSESESGSEDLHNGNFLSRHPLSDEYALNYLMDLTSLGLYAIDTNNLNQYDMIHNHWTD
ncbi:RHS repeat domain-containing protein [Cysteiniphilum litorale]|uniref:RHS repeat domain-containing protein n=1 Tax=Cysteiniphilum litorale TaxID=2056700 RepID=UPI003F8858E2